MGKPGEPESVQEFAETLSAQHLRCRTFGHYLQPRRVTVLRERRQIEGYEQTLRCKCGVVKVMLLDPAGRIVSSKYDYSNADGYLVHGLGRMDRDDRGTIRLTNLMRSLPEES